MKNVLILLIAVVLGMAAGAQETDGATTYEFLLAKLAAEEGRHGEALERLDRVIESSPADPVLRYERAMLLIEAGRLDRSEAELRDLAAKHPDFYDANRVLGRLILDRAGSDRAGIEEALVFLEAAFKARPDDLATGITVSQILISLSRIDDAERVLAQMVERSPDQRTLNFSYAQVLTKLGRNDESKRYLERTTAIDPTFSPAVMQLVEMYQQDSQWRRAALLLEPLLANDPANLELRRQQAYLYFRAGDARAARDRFRALMAADPQDDRTRYYLAEALNDLEEYAEAEQILRDLATRDPNDADVAASLGLTLSGQKKWDEAIVVFNGLLAMPEVPENLAALARTQLAWIDLQKGNYDAAIEAAKAISVFRDRPNPQAINVAIEALKRQEKQAEALGLLESLVAKFEDDAFLNARHIEALSRAGQDQKALERARRQLAVGPRNAIASAEAFIQAGKPGTAVVVMKEAVAAHPDDIDTLFQLGAVSERAGDTKGAEAAFLRILEKRSDHAPTLNYLGYMWAEGGVNLDRAHEMLVRAVAQEPDNGAYVDSLGWVYFRLGKLDLAERYLTDAARLLPKDATVHEHLGDVFAQQGDKGRALELYRTALNLGPASEEAEKLRSKIVTIERDSQTSHR